MDTKKERIKNLSLGTEMPESVSGSLGAYPEFLRKLLFHRGIETREAAEKFLNPSYERDSHDPFLMHDMKKAAERIIRAIENQEKIVVFGDYDCDGIPGSVVLHDFLKKIGYTNFENYIPHRHDEGYGLNIPALEKFAQGGVSLVITVDCGIVDFAQAESVREVGMDLIITDHHLPAETLPKAYAVVNPKIVGEGGAAYPDPMLCGAGVAFKLVQALLGMPYSGGEESNFSSAQSPNFASQNWPHPHPASEKSLSSPTPPTLREYFNIPVGWEKWLLDMAGLSTVADMVPLKNENRMIAHFGLKVLRKSPRTGLKKLLGKMRMAQENLSEDDIGFMIAPRINAASRMDVPLRAFELLSTRDDTLAETLADHLHLLNDQRKGIVAGMVKEAKHTLLAREVGEVIVTGNPKWPPGLLGLAASALVEHFSRPAFVWGRDGEGRIKGSCRSDGTVSVVELMSSAGEYFVQFGGHEASGGFLVSHEHIHTLEEKLSAIYVQMEKKENQELGKNSGGGNFVDAALLPEEVTWENYRLIEQLAPFGQGNPKPLFLFENLPIASVREFGKTGTHLEFVFKNTQSFSRSPSGASIKAIAFFTENKEKFAAGQKISFIASLEKDFFKNPRYPELRLRIGEIFGEG